MNAPLLYNDAVDQREHTFEHSARQHQSIASDRVRLTENAYLVHSATYLAASRDERTVVLQRLCESNVSTFLNLKPDNLATVSSR
uniref:DUF1330 domain-containing protein n=1 Tax=Panagrellus redivivus TaxID=6233 RepID=A0A7E4V4F4_PANRE